MHTNYDLKCECPGVGLTIINYLSLWSFKSRCEVNTIAAYIDVGLGYSRPGTN